MNQSTPTSGLPIANLNQDESVPRTRLSSAMDARSLVDTLNRANLVRAEVNAEVAGLVDGNPPFLKSDLKRLNQSNRSNFNDRTAEAFVNSAGSARYDIWSEAPTFAVIDTDYGSNTDRVRWGNIMTEEFQKLNRADRTLDYMKQVSDRECVLFGFGPVVFDDPNDYHCRAIGNLDVMVPDGTPCNIPDWDIAVVRIDYRVNQLYAFIEDEKMASEVGWDVEQVKKALINAAPKSLQGRMNGQSWTWYQDKIRQNDFLFSSEECTVPIASILYREFPEDGEAQGKISHAMILDRVGQTDSDPDKFLFQRLNRFDDWEQYIHGFYYDRGNGKHHGVKGIGIKFFGYLQHQNRFINALCDAGYARMQIHFQAATADNAQKLSIVQQGPYAIYPSGMEVAQINSAGVLDAPMAVLARLRQGLDDNLAQYRTAPTVKEGNPITAKEYQGNMAMRSALGNTELNRYYEQLDAFWDERFRRCRNPNVTPRMRGGREILKFQKACRDRGVPMEALQKARARAYRVVGQGSPYQRQAVLEKFMSLSGMFPEEGITAIKDDFIASLAGQAAVDRYNPKKRDDGASQDLWEAMSENADMKINAPVVVVSHQNNVIHLETHLQAASQAAAHLEQGADPTEVLQFLNAVGQHAAQHLRVLERDPTRKKVYDLLYAQFEQLGGVANQLRRTIKAQMDEQARIAQETTEAQNKAAAIASGQDPSTIIATAKAQSDLQLKTAAAQQEMRIKSTKAKQSLAIKDLTTAMKIKNESRIKKAK